MTLTTENIQYIKNELIKNKAVAFSYIIDECTEFSFLLAIDVIELNHLQRLSHNSNRQIWVSIIGKSAFRFSINSNFHPEYLCEKLNLVTSEAIKIQELLLEITKII